MFRLFEISFCAYWEELTEEGSVAVAFVVTDRAQGELSLVWKLQHHTPVHYQQEISASPMGSVT